MTSAVPDPTKEIVRLARLLERLIAKKRRVLKQYSIVDAEVVQTRKLLQDLTRPFAPAPDGRLCEHCMRAVVEHSLTELEACAPFVGDGR